MQYSANRGLGGLAVHPGDGFLPLPVCLLVLGDRSSALSPFISIKFLILVFFFWGGFTTTSPCTPRLLHQGTLGLPTVRQTPTHPEQRKQSVEAVWTRNAETLEAND